MLTFALHEALSSLASGKALTSSQTTAAVLDIIDGQAEPASIAAFLTALHFHGIDNVCLLGALFGVHQRMQPFEIPVDLRPVLDTCGTGGDGANSVNISTASALLVASCGVRVAKHGNKSASGNSGSAEVLSELGIKFDAEPSVLLRCLEDAGITFLFAPRFHPALRHAAPVRKLLPFRTIFNLIGPLANPVWPDAQLLGVPDRARAELIHRVLLIRDTQQAIARAHDESVLESSFYELAGPNDRRFRAYVVTGQNGLDEVTLSGITHVFPSHGPHRSELQWTAHDFGLPVTPDTALAVTGPKDSADKIRAMLAGERGPVRDVVLANAAAALKLVEKVDSLAEGVALAAEAIDRGDAATLLDRWARISNSR